MSLDEPTNPELANALKEGFASIEAQDLPRAIGFFGEAVRLDRSNPKILNVLGCLLHAEGRYHEAISRFKAEERLSPNRAETQINLALAHIALNDFVPAETALQRALEIDPAEARAAQVLADLPGFKRRFIDAQAEKFDAHLNSTLAKAVELGFATVGRWTHGPATVRSWQQSRLTVGSFCCFAEGVEILLGGEHITTRLSTFPFTGAHFAKVFGIKTELGPWGTSRGDVVIGNDVWVGTNVTILSGVTIGDGAVIAAGAVVTKDIAPYTIAGGVPAKTIRPRFSAEQIAHLLELKWWELSDTQIGKLVRSLYGNDVDRLVAEVRALRTDGSQPAL